MLEIETLIKLIPAFPLAAAIITAILGPRVLRSQSHIPTIVAIVCSFFCSVVLLFQVHSAQQNVDAHAAGFEQIVTLWTWGNVEGAYDQSALVSGSTNDVGLRDMKVDVVLRADALTAMMLGMVTFIASLVAIFAAGYMHGDRGYWRFFSYVSLFVFSMTMLVSVSNFVLLFVFWEAVGVCSYLLIGFWYQKPEAAAAGKKAFLVNRVGDFGFALALFLIWTTYGTLNFHDSKASGNDKNVAVSDVSPSANFVATEDAAEPAKGVVRGVLGQSRILARDYRTGHIALAICLLLMLGACGKSAQFPLHIWLPDAMEGPTPVSALIHAATMVTAGVYMVTRCTPLFMASPEAQLAVSCIGAFTALLAGLIALTQTDLKRVLAYSTVSQLGFMFLSLGTGTLAGITAGMFHLFTHAFFKALLFLGAGSVMHAMGGIIDIRRFSGLRKLMPITHATFCVGCVALAGLPPLAGFFSKDSVVSAVHDKAHDMAHELEHREHAHAQTGQNVHHVAFRSGEHGEHANPLANVSSGFLRCGSKAYTWLFYSAMFTAFMTSFYTFRAFFLTFYGEEKIPREAGHHAHESPPVMYWPLIVLAVCATFVGLLLDFTWRGGPHEFANFLGHAPSLAAGPVVETRHLDTFHKDVAGTSILIALAGFISAAYLYLGDHRLVDNLTTVMNLEGLSRWIDVEQVSRWKNVGPVAAIHRGASAIGLRWLTAFFGYVLLLVALLLSAPLLIGYYISPYRLSYRKFFWDEIYDWTIVKPLKLLAWISYGFDRWIVDGLVNLCGYFPVAVGALMRSLQMGLVQFYALSMVLGVLILLAAKLMWAAG